MIHKIIRINYIEDGVEHQTEFDFDNGLEDVFATWVDFCNDNGLEVSCMTGVEVHEIDEDFGNEEEHMRNIDEIRDYIHGEFVHQSALAALAAPDDDKKRDACIFTRGVLAGAEIALSAIEGCELPHGTDIGCMLIEWVAAAINEYPFNE